MQSKYKYALMPGGHHFVAYWTLRVLRVTHVHKPTNLVILERSEGSLYL
jgi:hypothetical protein